MNSTISASRIKQERLRKKYTQKELSKLMNVSIATISFWENGKKSPCNHNCKKLAGIFGSSMDYLIGHDTYVVSDSNENYGRYMAIEEIKAIEKLKEYEKLYNMIIENPERAFERINKKFF